MSFVITSANNPRVASVARLHRRGVRQKEQRTIVEGPQALAMALESGAGIELILTLDAPAPGAYAGAETLHVSESAMRRAAGTDHPRGPVGVVAIPDPLLVEAQDMVVLEGVSDPGNAGTLLRTAAALGMVAAFTAGTVDMWSPKVLRAAAGAHWLSPPRPVGGLGELHEHDLATVAMVADDGDPPALALAGSQPVAIIVGGEAHGLGDATRVAARRRLTIAMPGGMESLNAAVAGAIAMYERSRLVAR